jgi:hypothetical protein
MAASFLARLRRPKFAITISRLGDPVFIMKVLFTLNECFEIVEVRVELGLALCGLVERIE